MSDNQKELKSKIDKLVKSKHSENNYLALSLMQSQLGMSFEQAFNVLEMTLVKEASLFTDNIYLVKILDYSIYYAVEHCWATIKEYPFLEIRRTVKQSLIVLNKFNKIFTIDFFDSENQRDMFEAMSSLPNLGEGLEDLLS